MRTRSTVLLVELLVVILFFSLSSVIMLELFLSADSVSDEACTRNRALLTLEEWAERLAVGDEPEAQLFAGGFDGGDGVWTLDCEAFALRAEVEGYTTDAGTLWIVQLYALEETGEPILSVRADRYIVEVSP